MVIKGRLVTPIAMKATTWPSMACCKQRGIRAKPHAIECGMQYGWQSGICGSKEGIAIYLGNNQFAGDKGLLKAGLQVGAAVVKDPAELGNHSMDLIRPLKTCNMDCDPANGCSDTQRLESFVLTSRGCKQAGAPLFHMICRVLEPTPAKYEYRPMCKSDN